MKIRYLCVICHHFLIFLVFVKWCERELGIGNNCVVDWNNYMREVCANTLLNRQQSKIGGDTNNCFIVKVPNRSAATLLAAILENITEGSFIYTDNWRGFQRFTVNQRYNFVRYWSTYSDIERLWGSAKWRNKCYRGTERHHLDSYLSEFMWRRKIPFSVEPFDRALRLCRLNNRFYK